MKKTVKAMPKLAPKASAKGAKMPKKKGCK